jgi:hypothetical protein
MGEVAPGVRDDPRLTDQAIPLPAEAPGPLLSAPFPLGALVPIGTNY